MVDPAIAEAEGQLRAGRVGAAEEVLRRALAWKPNQPDILHALGLLVAQTGQVEDGAELIRRAIREKPEGEYFADLGRILGQSGRTAEAHEVFKKCIEKNPKDAVAFNNLGNVLRDLKKYDEASAALERSIELSPQYALAHYNLGNVRSDQEQLEEAAACFEKACKLRPDLTEAQNNLGSALTKLERYDEAIALYEKLLKAKPDHVKARNNYGTALWRAGRTEEAMKEIDHAIAMRADNHIAHNNRGAVMQELGKLDEAKECFRRSLRIKPDFADALGNLARLLRDEEQIEEVIAICHRAIERNPDYAEAHIALGSMYREIGRLEQAVGECRMAVMLKPELAEAHNGLGNCLRDQGDLDGAIECFQRGIELKSRVPGIHSNLAYTVYFHADWDARRILEVNRGWAEIYETPRLEKIKPHGNDKSPHRRLKIGYVSPDFRGHCAASFLLPLLANHDPANVEVFVYSGVRKTDHLTEKFKSMSHQWRDVARWTDEKTAEEVRTDKIDILVDLTLHMADNRLLTFARKPAPVQVTWLGYPGTTGLSTIDYRLTDPVLDPPGVGDELYSEKSVRLPNSFWCYEPMCATPDVNALPAAGNGFVTFGCLNNFVKVTPQTLELWAAVMREVRDSKLVILTELGSHRDAVVKTFERHGVSAERIEFLKRVPQPHYFKYYHRLDLCLDTVPYPGHTTTLDALWMGVPVVTLTGNTAASRGGASILRNLGLDRLIVHNPADYARCVAATVSNVGELGDLRARLRGMLQQSPLCDGKQFAADMEAAFRAMWKTWCESH